MAVTKKAKEKIQEETRQEEPLGQVSREEELEIWSTRDQEKRGSGLKGLNERQLARGMGLFSIGLGMFEIIAPHKLSRLIGIKKDHRGLVRLLGAREIASGIGLLTQRRPDVAAWSRVGGDAIDLSLLGAAFTMPKSNRNRLAATTAALAGVTALDLICSRQLGRRSYATAAGGAVRVAHAVTINRSLEELYRFWRNFNNLPRFMKHLESVDVSVAMGQTEGESGRMTGDKLSHWVANGPVGTRVEWDAEIIVDRPNEMIAWRSLEGAVVDHMGSVRFERAPGKRGTIVRVRLQYSPPAGVIGANIAKLLGDDPDWQVKDDLHRFKQIMEAGDVITTEGQPSGRLSKISRLYYKAAK